MSLAREYGVAASAIGVINARSGSIVDVRTGEVVEAQAFQHFSSRPPR